MKTLKEKIIEILEEIMPRKIDLPVKYLTIGDGQDKYISDIADQILEVVEEEKDKNLNPKKNDKKTKQKSRKEKTT